MMDSLKVTSLGDQDGATLVAEHDYPAVRTMADIEAIEEVPLEQRITQWDYAETLLQGCRINPERAALQVTNRGDIDGEVITWTFHDLEQRSIQIANLIRNQGLESTDTVAIISPTVPTVFACLIGGMLAARPFPINWMLEPHALADLLQRAQVKMVIALGPTPDFKVYENVLQALDQLPKPPSLFTVHDPFDTSHEHDLMNEARKCSADALEFHRPEAERHELACYVHSGGTTGHPKIVKILHGGMVYRQWAASYGLAFNANDVVLSDTPLFHIGGLLVRGLVSTANGHTAILPSIHGARDKRYLSNYWRYVERFGVTQISGVPTTLSVLAKNPPAGEDISSLRPYFATGSTAIPPAIQEGIAKITGASTLQSYGLTENTSHATLDPRDGEIRRGCSGIRVPYMQLRIAKIDVDGNILRDCDTDEVGMILVGGPGVAGGYLDSEQDRGAFLDDGFFVTGDLGSFDADGYLKVRGREKDLIIRGGHNIEPAQIEQALAASPEVVVAAAVGKPDAHAGELPIAYVELYPGAKVSADELLEFAARRIPERPAVPKELIILPTLPVTSIGKPDKQLLRLDAARRAFTEILQDLPSRWDLKVEAGAGNSITLALTLVQPSEEARVMAEQRLSAYSVPYSIFESPADH